MGLAPLLAEKEISERAANSRLSPERLHDLIFATTQDRDKAEKERARLELELLSHADKVKKV